MSDLANIKYLWRAPDTLTLWGIPYELREGQSPRDLLGIVSVADNLRGDYRRFKKDPASLGWVYLGSPGWWGLYDRQGEYVQEVKTWLASLACIPDGPFEYCRVELRSQA